MHVRRTARGGAKEQDSRISVEEPSANLIRQKRISSTGSTRAALADECRSPQHAWRACQRMPERAVRVVRLLTDVGACSTPGALADECRSVQYAWCAC